MLQLEYICTDAEMKEAQSLNTRQQLGKGSRVRTHLVLFGIMALAVGGLYLQIRTQVAPQYRPWILASIPVLFVFFFFKNRLARKPRRKTAKVELSDREVTVINGDARMSTQWSGFGERLESPNLFVLVDKTKRYLLVFPKRVFPDERSQDWFRNQAGSRPNVAASTADLPVMHSAPTAADGIVLNFQLGYRDYLNRISLSWWTKGFLLALYGFMIGNFFYMQAYPDPNAVNSPAKTIFVLALPTFTIMMVVMLPVAAFFTWRSHTKYLPPRQVALSADRIGLAEPDGIAYAPWTAYTYWRENRWCFVIWKGRQWDMLPKRTFASPADIEKCRTFLKQNLKRSRWFF